jgi:hypothetical protein
MLKKKHVIRIYKLITTKNYHRVMNAAKRMYQFKLILDSVNKSQKIWDFMKNESGQLEMEYNPIMIKRIMVN